MCQSIYLNRTTRYVLELASYNYKVHSANLVIKNNMNCGIRNYSSYGHNIEHM